MNFAFPLHFQPLSSVPARIWMEEDSPWGAPVSFAPPSPPPHLDHSPPLSTSLGTTNTTPSWGIDDGGGWGNSTTEDDQYGAFGTTAAGGEEDREDSSSLNREGVARKESVGDAWGTDTLEQQLPIPTLTTTTGSDEGRSEIESTSPRDDLEATPVRSPSLGAAVEDSPEDDRGWTPSTPPLPPISTLQISASSPSHSPTTLNNSTWDPSSHEIDQDPLSASAVPPPLPSVDDLFGNGLEKRESVGDGEEAWGAAQGWEARQAIERRHSMEARERALQASHEEEEQEEVDDVTEEERQEIERKVREAEEAAMRGEDNWGTTTAVAASRTSQESSGKGHKGDEYDLDAPEKAKKKTSWWGRSSAGGAQKQQQTEGDGVTDTVGAQEVQQGEPGKVTDESVQQQQQVGTIGRLFGRFKKNQANTTTSEEGGGGSARSSAEQPRPVNTRTENWKDEDFDALGSGKFGIQAEQIRRIGQQQKQEEDNEEEEIVTGGRFGSGRGSVKSRARIPTAPPEDDFGGLLGAFSTAPVRSQVSKPKPSQAFDPFDPLSDPPAPSPSKPVPSTTLKRPISSFAPSASTVSTSARVEDSFDAFFDSVTSSISKPPLSSIPTPPLPSSSAQRPPSLLLPKPCTAVPKRASPIPRMSSQSPPIRPTSASSTVSSRATTPILPLAPPPPPSQPLAQRNNLLLGSLAPPPASSQPVSNSSRPSSISPPPSTQPLSPTAAISRSSSPLQPNIKAPPVRGNSGPLSKNDLDFFENL